MLRLLLCVSLIFGCGAADQATEDAAAVERAVAQDTFEPENCSGLPDLSDMIEQSDPSRIMTGCQSSNEHPFKTCCLGESQIGVQCCWECSLWGEGCGAVACGALDSKWSGWD